MLGNSNYVDITGQIEEVFDEKIQQIPIATTEYVEDRIKEITEAQGTFDPAILDDYALVGHTHGTINNDLTVNGKLNGYNIHGSPEYKYREYMFIPTVQSNGVMEIGKYIDFHDYGGTPTPEYKDFTVRFENTNEKLLLYSINASGNRTSAQFRTYGDIELWEYNDAGAGNKRSYISGKVGGESKIAGNLTVGGTTTMNTQLHAKGSIAFGETLTTGARFLITPETKWSNGTAMADPFISIGKFANDTRLRVYESGKVAVQ